ncbi:MAG: choice-of-anchor D domain-containing protein [Cyclobacteriaceae bacterium]
MLADSLEEVTIIGKSNKTISNGDIKPEEKDGTYYGEYDIESVPVSKTFYIKYTNTVDPGKNLVITADILSDHALFVVTKQPEDRILSPGDSVAFEVTLYPEALTKLTPDTATTAFITIPNNVDFDKSFLFAVSAQITGNVDLSVAGNDSTIVHLDFVPAVEDSTIFGDSIDVNNETRTVTYWIYNEGNVDLELGSISSDNPVFSVTQPGLTTIPKGGSVSFQVTFDPEVSGPETAIISIVNNAYDDEVDDKNPYQFAVQGTGVDNAWIIVKGNNQTIEIGDVTPTEADHTDFGRVNASEGIVSRTYWIHNEGTANLTLTGAITVNNSVFRVGQPSASIIPPNDSISFTITFDPVALGDTTATVFIPNNDEDQHPFTFLIQGEGTEFIEATVKGNEQIIVSGDTLPSLADSTHFDRIFTNREPSSQTHTFWILSTGIDSLFITGGIQSDNPQFTVTQPAGTQLAAGDSISFTVTFSSGNTGNFSATISIPTDDAARNPYTFVVSGEAVVYVEAIHGVPVAVNDTFNIKMTEFLEGNVLTDAGIDTLSLNAPNTVTLEEVVSQGTLALQEDGSFTYVPLEGLWGEDRFTYRLCDVDADCSEATVVIYIEGGGIITYDAFSPDGDGVNDQWEVDNIANYVNNRVVIFNRWGNIVWQASNYDNKEVSWQGDSNAGVTMGNELPDGTYFYIIEGEALHKEQGYVVISRKR